MTRNTQRSQRTALAVLILLTVPHWPGFASWSQSPPIEANPPAVASSAGYAVPDVSTVQSADPNASYPVPENNTIQETAEQNDQQVVDKVTKDLLAPITTHESGRNTETYNGMAAWYADDLTSNIYANIYQLVGRWLSENLYCWTITIASLSLIFDITLDLIYFILTRASKRCRPSGLCLLMSALVLHGIGSLLGSLLP